MSAREFLLGPSYFHHRRLIAESRSWSPDDIRAYQDTRFERLIRRYGNDIREKHDYRQHLPQYTRWNVPLITRTVRTGGTSGQPLRFRADTLARRQKERAYLFDIWSQVGYKPHDIRVVYRGNAYPDLIRLNRIENAWIVSPSATTRDRLASLRDWASRLPPFFLHVYPSSLITFIDLIGEDLFRRLPIKGVLAGSETFPSGEIARFEEDFGIRVAHWYGHSEYAVLAYCCRGCQSFHFYPTYGYAELLPSETGGLRHVIASSFNRIGTQFVRYDTGDLVTAAPQITCTNNFLRAGAVVGRSRESFLDNSGCRRALGPYIFGIHGSFWDQVRDIQFVQDSEGLLRIRLVTTVQANKRQLEEILEQRLPMVKIDFEYLSFIERNPNGKRQYFIDESQRNPRADDGGSSEKGRPR